MIGDFRFSRQGRTQRTVGILPLIYGSLISAVALLDAAWWLMAGLFFLTIPAILDLWRNPESGLSLTPTTLDWFTGRHKGTLEFHEIDHMRFDTRWDFSVRVTAMLPNKKRVRLPYQCLPPHRQFEAELQGRGINVKRHHFVVI